MQATADRAVKACPRPSGRGATRGFTLVELLVTIVVAAVLIAIAVPSFHRFILSSRLTTTANDVVAALNTARMEAIKRNAGVQVCSDSSSSNAGDALGSACTAQGAGAVVATMGSTTQPLRAALTGIDSTVKLNGGFAAVRFSAQGLGFKPGSATLFTGTVADICTSALKTRTHRLIAISAGSVITTTTSDEPCP